MRRTRRIDIISEPNQGFFQPSHSSNKEYFYEWNVDSYIQLRSNKMKWDGLGWYGFSLRTIRDFVQSI